MRDSRVSVLVAEGSRCHHAADALVAEILVHGHAAHRQGRRFLSWDALWKALVPPCLQGCLCHRRALLEELEEVLQSSSRFGRAPSLFEQERGTQFAVVMDLDPLLGQQLAGPDLGPTTLQSGVDR